MTADYVPYRKTKVMQPFGGSSSTGLPSVLKCGRCPRVEEENGVQSLEEKMCMAGISSTKNTFNKY